MAAAECLRILTFFESKASDLPFPKTITISASFMSLLISKRTFTTLRSHLFELPLEIYTNTGKRTKGMRLGYGQILNTTYLA